MAYQYVLDFRASSVGGAVVPPKLLSADGRFEVPISALQPPNPPPSFIIHGFNNSRSEGLAATTGFSDLLVSDGLGSEFSLVAVLWPGDNLLSPLSYFVEEKDARNTANQFVRFLVGGLHRKDRPNFVAHSLGSLVALETIRGLHAQDVLAGEVILMAGAVDDDCLARKTRYRKAVESAKRVTVVSSRRDRALHYGFPVGDFVAGLLYGGYTRKALGYRGAEAGEKDEPIPMRVDPCPLRSEFGVDHGDYLPGAEIRNTHRSAAVFVADCLRGEAPCVYRDPRDW